MSDEPLEDRLRRIKLRHFAVVSAEVSRNIARRRMFRADNRERLELRRQG